MSSRRDLEIRLGSLNEIKEIMSAMKNLSLMEVHKLGRFLESQRRVIDSIEAAAADLLQFHRTLFPESVTFRDFYLLVGSERGFCGDFNEALVRALEKHAVTAQEKSIVVVGAKLATKLAGDARLRAAISGASVAEEIDGVLVGLMDALTGTPRAGSFRCSASTNRVASPAGSKSKLRSRSSSLCNRAAPGQALLPCATALFRSAALSGRPDRAVSVRGIA